MQIRAIVQILDWVKKDWVQQNIKSWNELSEVYAEQFMEPGIFQDSYDKLAAQLARGASVLEIACGPGNIYSYLHKVRPDLEVLLTDSSERMLLQVKHNFPSVPTRLLTTRKLKTISAKYDALIAGFVLPYIGMEEGRKFIGDVFACLKSDGLFYFSYILGEGEFLDQKGNIEMKQYRYSEADVNDMIGETNCRIESDFTLEDPKRPGERYRILILRKL